MKKIVPLLFLILCSGITNAQMVNIPDANFKAKLILDGYDTNSDGDIQISEALAITYLQLSFQEIYDLTGIQSFTNLAYLDCRYNHLTSINIAGLIHLHGLQCDYNNLTSLNVTGLNNLTSISCIGNSFTDLDFSGLTNLVNVDLGVVTNNLNLSNTGIVNFFPSPSFNVGSLNMSNCANLTILNLDVAHVPHINLTGCTALTTINMEMCGLQELDVSSVINLQTLSCSFNYFTTLDVSNNPNLTSLICSSAALQYLYAKNGSNEGLDYTINGAPNLIFACVDDFQVGPLLNVNTNAVISSYCTFTPGGNYNTIAGTIKYDFDNNGCDSNDLSQPNIRVNLNDGTTTATTFTNASANYLYYTQAGSFNITPALENASWFTFSPSTVTIPFADNNSNTATQDFCITANGVHPDVEVLLVPITLARPGFNAVYKLMYRNKGNVSLSNWTGLSLNYDSTKMTFVTASQSTTNSAQGSLEFGYSVNPFESGSIEITFHINAPTDPAATNIGDQLLFTAALNPAVTDENPTDNTFNYTQTVVGSYDPNDIICMQGNLLAPSEIGKYLDYVINFENTGTFQAENIVIKDTIDTTKYDLSTLQVINSSHPVATRITGNAVEFIFENVNLQAAQHGNIVFKIKSRSDLLVGNTVSSNANIYFDYNAPVATNTASTTYQNLGVSDFQLDANISVYPNPTHNVVNIKANNMITSVQLFDAQGRLLQTKLVNENNTTLDITKQSAGVYFIKATTDKGIKVQKIVKE